MSTIQFIQITPQELQDSILEGVKKQIQDLKKDFQKNKEPNEYLGRDEVAKLLNISKSTLWSWTKKGILKSYSIGRRLYYKRHEVEKAIVELKK